eukprot:c10772_g1_i1.p1 GENE.c10772_g1_i1~~c10772_g1_i1.p1  ORF type:complete len:524 (-),score=126.72 c10772_g1_i1:124-1665(-)
MFKQAAYVLQSALANEIQKTVLKATTAEENFPKQKHLEEILRRIEEGPETIQIIVTYLDKRIREKSWMVVLKCLIIVRKMLAEGGRETASVIRNNYRFLNLSDWTDDSSPNAVRYSRILRNFARYLNDVCLTMLDLPLRVDCWDAFNAPVVLKSMTVDEMTDKTNRLFQALASLLACPFSEVHLTAPEERRADVITSLFLISLKDALGMYSILESARLIILDVFFDLRKSTAELLLKLLQEFDESTHTLSAMCKLARDLSPQYRDALPDIHPVSHGLISKLQDHVDSLHADHDDSGDVPVVDLSTLLNQDEMLPSTLEVFTDATRQPTQPQKHQDFFDLFQNQPQQPSQPQQSSQPQAGFQSNPFTSNQAFFQTNFAAPAATPAPSTNTPNGAEMFFASGNNATAFPAATGFNNNTQFAAAPPSINGAFGNNPNNNGFAAPFPTTSFDHFFGNFAASTPAPTAQQMPPQQWQAQPFSTQQPQQPIYDDFNPRRSAAQTTVTQNPNNNLAQFFS